MAANIKAILYFVTFCLVENAVGEYSFRSKKLLYSCRSFLHSLSWPFRGAHIADDEQPFNTEMSKVRACVEWGFGKICLNFTYLDFKKNLKVLLQPVGKYYLEASILINCHACLYGS